ncbi:MAG: hypothetical protein ACK4WC_04545 [Rubrimonas sp.]
MKTIALALAAALAAAPVLAGSAVAPVAGPGAITGNTPMIGAREAHGATSRITSPIAWIVHVAPTQAPAAAARSAGVVTAPAASSGARDVARAEALLPVALR